MATIKKMTGLCFLLLLPAMVAFILNWHWSPIYLNSFSWYWVALTETAGNPIAMITSVVFFLIFVLILKINTWSLLWRLAVIVGLALLLGQGIKSIVKNYSVEPRPYVLWMEEVGAVNHTTFYSAEENMRQSFIASTARTFHIPPKEVLRHWQQEINYSFPSGHTLFAATWAFLAIIFLRFCIHYIVITVMIGWTLIIEISRLVLGMHHPGDIAASVIIAYFICLGVYFCAKRWHIVEYCKPIKLRTRV